MVYLIHYVTHITPLKLRRQMSNRHAQDRPGGEVKLSLNMDSRVRYEWTSAGGPLNFDTHGDPYDAPKDFQRGYGKGRNQPGDKGQWVAAFAGKHG
jgi:hypothetical protein